MSEKIEEFIKWLKSKEKNMKGCQASAFSEVRINAKAIYEFIEDIFDKLKELEWIE